jgi:hypothetical protein
MANPFPQDGSQVLLTERDHEIQALPLHRTNQALTVGIGLRCPDRRRNKISAAKEAWERAISGKKVTASLSRSSHILSSHILRSRNIVWNGNMPRENRTPDLEKARRIRGRIVEIMHHHNRLIRLDICSR